MSTIPPPGEQAPDFSLPGDGGHTISLSDYVGRKLVLFFYPRDDTRGCTREAKEFSAMKTAFASAGTEIVGVSADTPKSHEKFKAKHSLQVTLVSDTSLAMLKDYGVWLEKTMYGRKYMGIERTTVLVDRNGTIARTWRKVKVPGHVETVLKAAQKLV